MSDASVTVTIPVVVHVVFNTLEQNISVAQIQSQIDVLNEDFRRRNADANQTPSQFSGVAADANIEFKLACMDPNGNPTTGIVRATTTTTGFTYQRVNSTTPDEAAIGVKYVNGAAAWPSDKYLNIWTYNFVDNVLGYARFPGTTTADLDGVVVAYNALGRVGTLRPQYDRGRTATHEIGHWLNVFHIWGDDNCGNDFCSDTPTQLTNNFGCVSFPHVTCSNNGDMSMNYMDYSDDACRNLFTNNQKDRMRALFVAGGFRESFISTKIQQSSASVCSSTTFSVAPNSGAAVNYNWTVTGPAQITAGQGTNQVTVNPTGSGTGTLTVSANGYCDSKAITIGPPGPVTGRYECASNTCSGTQQLPNKGPISYQMDVPPGEYNIYLTPPAGTSGFQPWQGPPTSSVNWYYTSSGTARVAVHMTLNAYQSASFTVTTQSGSCGSSTLSFNFHASGGASFAASPNPVSDQLTVTSDGTAPESAKSATTSTSAVPFTALLFDTYGKQVKTTQSTNGKAILNVRDLPDGLYNLRINTADKPVMQHIQITH